MEMRITDWEGNCRNIGLSGRLDTQGVGLIETRFLAAVVPAGKHAIVDMSEVEYIASLGIRMLISAARSLRQRDAKFALYATLESVNKVLADVSLSQIVPICADAEEALAAVRA